MSNLNFLKKVAAFKGLNDEQLVAVQGCCNEKEFKLGEKLFGERDDATCLWVVMEGKVDLRFDLPGRPTSDENNISTLSVTQTFGWSTFVPPYKYRLSAYCTTNNCKVVQVNKEDITNLFKKDNKIGYIVMSNLAAVVGKRFHQLQDDIARRRGQDIMDRESGW